MQQTSKLSIVVDTSNAKQRLSDFTKQLNDVTKAATNMAEKVEKSLSAKGSQGASSQISSLTRETNLLGTAAQQAALMQDRLTTSAAKTATAQANATKAAANAATAQNRQAASANSVTISNNSLAQSEFAVERAMNKTIATETRLQIIQNSLAGSALRLGTAQQNAATSTVLNQNKVAASHQNLARTTTMADLATSKLTISQHNEATAAGRTTTQLVRLSTEERRLEAATSAAAGAATRAATNLNGLARSVISVQREEAKLQADLLRTNALAERQAAAAARAAAGLNGMGNAADRASNSSRGLHGSMNKLYTVLNSGLVAVTGLGFIKTAAEMQNLNNQIRLVTDSEREYIGMKQLAGKIADENFADINATINLYQKSVRALTNLGKSQADSIKFTEAVSLAMRTGGRSAGENAAAILQLGQAMGAGVIMGDEFRSISENAPVLLKLVAKEMGVLQGDLKKLSADGKITAEIMYNAMTKNMDELEELAKKMPLTMGQAFVVAKNNYKKYTDEMMNSTGGVSDKISGMLVKISANFDTIAKVGIAGMVLGLVSVTASVVTATNAMKLFNLVTSANPLMLIVSGFLLVTSAIFGTNEVLTISGIMLGDFFDGMSTMLKDGEKWWMDFSNTVAVAMGITVKEVAEANDKNSKNFLGFYEQTEKGFAGVVQGLGTAIGSVTAIFGTFFELLGRWTDNMFTIFENMGKAAYNAGNRVRMLFGGDNQQQEYGSLKSLDGWSIYKNTFNINQDGIRSYAQGLNQQAGITPTPLDKGWTNPLTRKFDFTNLTVVGKNTVLKPEKATLPEWLIPKDSNFRASTSPIDPQAKLAYETKKIREEEEKRLENLEKLRKEQEKQNKADKKELKNLIPKAVSDAILAGAKELGVNPNDLAAVISFETGGTFSTNSRNPTSSATGLIQFMDGSDGKNDKKYYGHTRDEFGSMLPLQQMDYVVKYLKERGIKPADGVAEIYDAVAGYGYKRGSAGYEGNKVWDVNKDGVVAKGEAVTGKRFKAHIKDYYGDGVSIAQESIASIYAAELKMAEEQQKKREALRKEYGTAAEVIASNLDAKLKEIDGAGFDEEETKLRQDQAIRDANIELATYQETLDRKVDALDAWRKTERGMLIDARNNAKFDALTDTELRKSENQEYLQYALNAADREFEHKTKLLNLSQEKEALGLFEYASTDRRMFEEGWRLKIAEAKLATDELKDIRIKAYEAEYAKDQELFNLNEKKKLLSLREGGMGAGEYMLANQQLNIQGINADSSLSPEEKRLQINAARQPLNDALTGIMSEINPQSENERIEQEHKERLEILDAYESQYTSLVGVQSAERIAIEQSYQDAKRDLMITKGGETLSDLTMLSKAFLGEQSSLYKGLFAMEKAYTLASVLMKNQEAISKAWASAPFPYNLGAVASTVAGTAGIASAVAGIVPQGFEKGGYTGSMGTKDIAGVVHGQEYVFDAQSTKRIGVDNLNAMRSGKAVGGGGDVNINVNVDAKGNANVSGDNERMGRDMANGIKAVVIDTLRKEKRQGGMLYA